MFQAENCTTLQTPGPRNAEMKRLTLSFLRRKVARLASKTFRALGAGHLTRDPREMGCVTEEGRSFSGRAASQWLCKFRISSAALASRVAA